MGEGQTEIIVSLLNSILLIGNIYWQWSFKKRGTEIQLLQSMTEENKAKDELISDLEKSLDHYKHELESMSEEYKRIQAELQTYRSAEKGGSV